VKAKRSNGSTPRAARPKDAHLRPIRFTEPGVANSEKKLFRARSPGLRRDQAEAVMPTLKRSDISCITIKN